MGIMQAHFFLIAQPQPDLPDSEGPQGTGTGSRICNLAGNVDFAFAKGKEFAIP